VTRRIDADAQLVRRTAFRVGLWLTVAVSVLVIAVLIAAFAFVFKQVPLDDLFDRHRHQEMVDVGGLDVIVGGIVIGLLAVALAGTLGLIATRRAVAPLVDALGRQRRFVADASHELRTPLAILDARLQLLERSIPPGDPNHALVTELRDDSRNVNNVVSDLLDSLDVSDGGAAAPTQVAPIVDGALRAMQMLATERDVRVTSAPIPPELDVLIPDTSLHRALVALLDNAVKHSSAGQVVTVTADGDRNRVTLAVSDSGPGIRGIQPQRVFDRFARSSDAVDGGGTARTGFGIGLSLVQDTVGRFGGTVEVAQTSESGTTITMTLPRARGRQRS
jgi:signal transduction histidine kinase